MIEFQKPNIQLETKTHTPTFGEFVVEPLERGYANTLGNALRRIMLSSLPGAAVTSVKIEGVQHEFSSIEGVAEDVVEIVLNLKRLAIKTYDNEPKVAYIKQTGPKEVTAADIECPSDVEIFNKDLHIASLMSGATLEMTLTIESGRGYVGSDENKKDNMPIGTIPVDSIFSPVKKVNFQVRDKRIGSSTNFDTLVFTVETDGTLSPEDSLSLSAKILNDHLQLFIDMNESLKGMDIMVERAENEKEKFLEMSIDELELSVRSSNCLRRAGINTVEDLTIRTEDEMGKIRNLGKKSLNEIKKKLAENSLSFRQCDE